MNDIWISNEESLDPAVFCGTRGLDNQPKLFLLMHLQVASLRLRFSIELAVMCLLPCMDQFMVIQIAGLS